MKFDVAPPLNALIERAQEIFNKAHLIVVVGFSFADADLYISRMLTKSLQTSKAVRMLVFDPDYSVVEKIRRQLSTRIPGFDQKRVITFAGDCSKTIPQFLSGQLFQKKHLTPKRKVPLPSVKTIRA